MLDNEQSSSLRAQEAPIYNTIKWSEQIISVTQQLTPSRVFVPRNNSVMKSRTRKKHYMPSLECPSELRDSSVCILQKEILYMIFTVLDKSTRRNLRNKPYSLEIDTYCIFIKRLMYWSLSNKQVIWQALVRMHTARQLQPYVQVLQLQLLGTTVTGTTKLV